MCIRPHIHECFWAFNINCGCRSVPVSAQPPIVMNDCMLASSCTWVSTVHNLLHKRKSLNAAFMHFDINNCVQVYTSTQIPVYSHTLLWSAICCRCLSQAWKYTCNVYWMPKSVHAHEAFKFKQNQVMYLSFHNKRHKLT